MRTIIAGSRDIVDPRVIPDAVEESEFEITQVISGGARGVDALAIAYADLHKIPLRIFRANWDKHGKSAGYIRNQEMANYAEALIAIWDSKSVGTKHMIKIATDLGLSVHVHMV